MRDGEIRAVVFFLLGIVAEGECDTLPAIGEISGPKAENASGVGM